MTIIVTPHLNFRGNAREALAFYETVFGGRSVIVTFGQAGYTADRAEADQVMWGQVESEDGVRLMAFDVPPGRPWNPGEAAFFISVRTDTTAKTEDYWSKLTHEGTVIEPLAPSPWAPLYGMVKDRFGIIWVLDVAAQHVA